MMMKRIACIAVTACWVSLASAQVFNPIPDVNVATTPWSRGFLLNSNVTEAANHLMLDYAVNAAWYGVAADGQTDDANAIQAAVDEALTSGRTLYIPEGTYRVDSTIFVDSNETHYTGFRWVQSPQAKLIWGGGSGQSTIACIGVDHTHWVGLTIDGNDISNSKGLAIASSDTWSAQHHLLELCRFYQFKSYGTKISNVATGTCDYVTFEQCQWWDCKNGVEIYGGARQVSFQGGSIINSSEHGIYLSDSAIDAHGLFLGVNTNADVYLPVQHGSFQMFGCMSESETIIKTSSTAGWPDSKHLPPNLLSGMNQSPNPDWPADANSIIYNSSRPLKLDACKFLGTVWIGPNSGNLVVSQVDFWNSDYPSSVGFTGANAGNRLTLGDGTLGNTARLSVGALESVVSGGNWPLGVTIYDVNDEAPRTMYFADSSPDNWGTDARRYYFRQGDIVWNMNPSTIDEAMFWGCLVSGDFASETTYANFHAWYGLDAKGQWDYTSTNATEDRTFDCDSTTVEELADVLATLLGDLQVAGITQ
jgi:hypothetical protein